MNDFSKYKPSTISLLIANAVPLIGVLLFGWSTFAVVALYWAENVVIGLVNILKIITCKPDIGALTARLRSVSHVPAEQVEKLTDQLKDQWANNSFAHQGIKLFLVPFFTFHYGLFCFVHGMFVFVLLSGDGPLQGGPPSLSAILRQFSEEHLWWGVAALMISHLVSFFTNYLGQGEYRRTMAILLMFQPYLRIVVLHIAILFGAFATIALGSPVVVVILLIFGKTALDLHLHLRERQRNAVAKE